MRRRSAQFQVSGRVAPGYETVRQMFEENFRSGSEENSQLCVYVEGELVVDLWTNRDGFTGWSKNMVRIRVQTRI